MHSEQSERLFKRAVEAIPGGVNSPVRSFQAVNMTPRFIERAKGATLFDVDGNAYTDYVNSWGPCILGHAHPTVLSAVEKAIPNGLSFGACTQGEIILAELVKQCMPHIEKVRLTCSGTEAVMSAIRLARAYTGRKFILKFSGSYHGHSDSLLVKSGSGLMTNGIPNSSGVPWETVQHTLLAEWNQIETVEKFFTVYPDKIAGVILEPIPCNMGVIPPEEGFLSRVKELCVAHKTLLIFDEVITGFRLGLGGASAYFGIRPDLVTLGKIIGGGMPIGAYGGRADIMQHVAPLGSMYQAGTLSGNPLATSAGIATLSYLIAHPEVYVQLASMAKRIADTVADMHTPNLQCNQMGSLLTLFFHDTAPTTYTSVLQCDTARYGDFFCYLLEHHIYFPPSQFEAIFLSMAHTEEDIDSLLDTIRGNFA